DQRPETAFDAADRRLHTKKASDVLPAERRRSNDIAVGPAWGVEGCKKVLHGIRPAPMRQFVCRAGGKERFLVDGEPRKESIRIGIEQQCHTQSNTNCNPLNGTEHAQGFPLPPWRAPDKSHAGYQRVDHSP